MNFPSRILVVEDEAEVREFFAAVLRAEGYEVMLAETVGEGWRIVQAQRPEVVLLDVSLPDGSGLELCRRIKKDATLIDVFVALCSGVAREPADRAAGLEGGADDYLSKPIAPEELVARMRNLLRLRATTVELRASESRFHSLFDGAPIALALHDADGHLINVNAAYQKMLGYSEEELRQRGVKRVTVPEDIAAGQQFFAEIRDGRRDFYRREKRYQNRAGQVVWADSSAAAVRDGSGALRYVISMVEDITGRKQLDAELRHLNETLEQRVRERTAELEAVNLALRESETRLRLALDASGAGSWSWEAATNRSQWDAQYHELYGFQPEDPVSHEAWISRVHPDDRARLEARIESLLQPGSDSVWNEEFRALHPVKGERWMAGMGRVIRDAGGNVINMVGINLDVTARKQAEQSVLRMNEVLEQRVRERTLELERSNESLRESERRFRQLAETIDEVFWITDPEKREILYVSPAYEKIWGRTCQSLQADARAWMAALHPEDRERIAHAALNKQVAGEYDEEYRILRPDGSLRWIHDRAFPVRTDAGQVVRVVGVAEDITDRKHTERALRESEVRKTAVMESAVDAIITVDQAGFMVEANPAAGRMFGHNPAQMPGHKFAETLLPAGLRDWFAAGLAAEFAGNSGPHLLTSCEFTAVRAGGLEFPAELNLTAIRPEGRTLFIAFIRDLTAQRRAEEQVRLLADALQSTREIVSITDAQNRFSFVNQAFLDAYGYTPAEVLGQTPEMLQPAGRVVVTAMVLEQTLAGGWRGELTNRRKDGSEFPILLSTARIASRAGDTIGLVGVAQDITEAKRTQKQTMAFSILAQRLSGVTTTAAAAETIVGVASVLFTWDAGYVHLYDSRAGLMVPVLTIDTIEGQRQPVPPGRVRLRPTALTQQVLERGAKLINRTATQDEAIKLVPFGSPRRSASLMFVPIRSAGVPVGILSIQSYSPRAYTEDDLQVLQILAAHCGDALRRIEITDALQAAEAKYRGIVENAAEGIFQTTPEGRYLTANPAQARLLGFESPADLISRVTDIEKQTYAVPAQRTELLKRMETEGQVQGFEVERVRRDGQKIWVSLNGHAVRDAAGETLYYECTSHDITQRKLAELELRRLSHLILEAREAERQRVARELHDGVNQIIASARMRLSKVRERSPELGPAAREILSRSEALLVEALEENRRIAHNLRPGDLDHLGLAAVCRNFCRELSANSSLDARCRVTGFAERLDAGLELNLFRVLQEATNNIQQHARAKSVRVNLTWAGGDVRLTIRDDGRGFDLEKVKRPRRGHGGVGLTSMRERVTNLGGTFEVKSVPKQGTTIVVRVPAVEAAARPRESGD